MRDAEAPDESDWPPLDPRWVILERADIWAALVGLAGAAALCWVIERLMP